MDELIFELIDVLISLPEKQCTCHFIIFVLSNYCISHILIKISLHIILSKNILSGYPADHRKIKVWFSLQLYKGNLIQIWRGSYTTMKGILHNYEGDPIQIWRKPNTTIKGILYKYKGDPIQLQRESCRNMKWILYTYKGVLCKYEGNPIPLWTDGECLSWHACAQRVCPPLWIARAARRSPCRCSLREPVHWGMENATRYPSLKQGLIFWRQFSGLSKSFVWVPLFPEPSKSTQW